ncbi:G-type lectin S-receptor-like serine/threonine-protein kinase At1g67520 [Ipomoea triloba]|uniref:G-type lectin S-receptor-like serine/threonine-protein kinase At1g67520 n=1 Tax=Ipomoea triloba TaxID=35885 RepID=UPI00125D0E5F|nr:G-type lectin S-receptor-like serine/threonine-protein kinase At1g67520 [Ipomoea triloba]
MASFLHAGLVSQVSAKSELGPGEILSSYDGDLLELSSAVLQFGQVGDSGIWYLYVESTSYGSSSTSEEKRIWVAWNSWKSEIEDPHFPKLKMEEGGRLVVISTTSSNGTAEFVINAEQHAYIKNTTAVLISNGNLILLSPEGKILWESFDHPTNLWFPGMKLGWFGLKTQRPHQRFLTSWISRYNPSPGVFTLGVDPNNTKQLVVLRKGGCLLAKRVLEWHHFSISPTSLQYHWLFL